MDKIMIRGIRVRCIIGVNGWERRTPQTVLIDADLFGDWAKAGRTDDLRHAVDYRDVTKSIVSSVTKTRFHLLEKLADHVARCCMDKSPVRRVTVRVFKPRALSDADTVGVELTRSRRHGRT